MRGEEERIAESCPASGGLVACGMTKGDETCWFAAARTTDAVRGNRGILLLPVPAEAD